MPLLKCCTGAAAAAKLVVPISNESVHAKIQSKQPCIGTLSIMLRRQSTGILIHQDMVLTSHGNLPDFQSAEDGEIVLSYSSFKKTAAPRTILTRRLLPSRYFLTSPQLDLTLVACEPVTCDLPPLILEVKQASRDTLEAGHRVYILGHKQNSEKRGITAFGHGRVASESDVVVEFLTDGCIWLPGSAGFDELGDFSFMVIDSERLVSEIPLQRRKSSVFRKEVARQSGVPIQAILDWMEQHGLKNINGLPIHRNEPSTPCPIKPASVNMEANTSSIFKASRASSFDTERSENTPFEPISSIKETAEENSSHVMNQNSPIEKDQIEKGEKSNDLKFIAGCLAEDLASGLKSFTYKSQYTTQNVACSPSEPRTQYGLCYENATKGADTIAENKLSTEIVRVKESECELAEEQYEDVPLESPSGTDVEVAFETKDDSQAETVQPEGSDSFCGDLRIESGTSQRAKECQDQNQVSTTNIDGSSKRAEESQDQTTINLDGSELLQLHRKEVLQLIPKGHGEQAESSRIKPESLQPEEISKRIEGYGNVTMIARKDCAGLEERSSPTEAFKSIPAPLNRVIDVGSSLVQKGASAIGLRHRIPDEHSIPLVRRKAMENESKQKAFTK